MNKYLLFSIVFSIFLSACSNKTIKLTKGSTYKNEEEYKSQNLDKEESKEVAEEVDLSLQQKLDSYADIAKTKIPVEKKKVMIEALQRLKNKNMNKDFPKIGDKAPNFDLEDFYGNKIELYDVLEKKAVVLLFYRGSWCPYCNLELVEYKKYYQAFVNEGVEILAISPELPEYSQRFHNKHFFPFPLLFDKKNRVADKFDLVFKLDPELKPIYKEFGIDLEVRNDDSDWKIPVPATLVISKDRIIKYVFADIDYKNRAEPDSVLAVIRARL